MRQRTQWYHEVPRAKGGHRKFPIGDMLLELIAQNDQLREVELLA